MKQPLVSVIILSYNTYPYIYEAIDSILKQDYDNIEIIINNDGSRDFKENLVRQYLNKHKRNNIKNVTINNSKSNIGTVKSANWAVKNSHGEYLIIFAADDAAYGPQTISQFIKAFKQLPKEEYIVTAQLEMCDLELKNRLQLFLNPAEVSALKNLSPRKLFGLLSKKCIIAAPSTCYKKKLFEDYGYFDERYQLVEDYSYQLKLSRMGVRFNYFDFIAFKHRDGGISHGNVKGEQRLNKKYDSDIVNIMKYEILPYLSLLTPRQKKKFLERYKLYRWKFSYNYFFLRANTAGKRKFVRTNWQMILFSIYVDVKEYLLDQLVGKKLKVLLLGLSLLLFTFFGKYYQSTISEQLVFRLRLLAYFLILEVLLLTICQIFLIIGSRINKMIRYAF